MSPTSGDAGAGRGTLFGALVCFGVPCDITKTMLSSGADPLYVMPTGAIVLVSCILRYKTLGQSDQASNMLSSIDAMLQHIRVYQDIEGRRIKTIPWTPYGGVLLTAAMQNYNSPTKLLRLLFFHGVDPDNVWVGDISVLESAMQAPQPFPFLDFLAYGANPFKKGPLASSIIELAKKRSPPHPALWGLLIFEAQEKAAMALLMCWHRLRHCERQHEEPDASLASLPRDVIRLIFIKHKYAIDHCIT